MPKKKETLKVPKQKKPKPETEIKLEELQDKYLGVVKRGEDGKVIPPAKDDLEYKQVLNDFFGLMQVYARSLVLKELKRKRLFYEPQDVDGAADEAALLLMRQYNKPSFCIRASFAGALRFKVLEALYKYANEDKTYSLNKVISSSNSSNSVNGAHELQDITASLGATNPWGSSYVDPASEYFNSYNAAVVEVQNILDIADKSFNVYESLVFRCWLLLKFRRPHAKNIDSRFNSLFLNEKETRAFELLFMEIRNRIEDSHVMSNEDNYYIAEATSLGFSEN